MIPIKKNETIDSKINFLEFSFNIIIKKNKANSILKKAALSPLKKINTIDKKIINQKKFMNNLLLYKFWLTKNKPRSIGQNLDR